METPGLCQSDPRTGPHRQGRLHLLRARFLLIACRRARLLPEGGHPDPLALLYALTDGARHITARHLRAALNLWDYAARSAHWAAGQATAGPLAQRIADALAAAGPQGLTRTQIRDTLGRNQPAANIDTALAALAAEGRAHNHTDTTTGGRPAQTWTTTTAPGGAN